MVDVYLSLATMKWACVFPKIVKLNVLHARLQRIVFLVSLDFI